MHPDLDGGGTREALLTRSVELVAGSRCLVLDGPLGIGKSHLLGSIGHHLRSQGWRVTHFVANSATATIPFGAVADIVSGTPGLDRVSMLKATVETLKGTTDQPRVILVDDAHHLDPESTAVLSELGRDGGMPITMTIRSGEIVPGPVQDLISSLRFAVLTLPPLDAYETESLIRAEARSNDPEVVGPLAERSQGNALFASELGRAYSSGSADVLSPQLVQLVRARLGRLSEPARHQLGLVAIADPLDTGLVVTDPAALQELERASVITTAKTDGVLLARVSHPLYGEVVISGLTPLDRRILCRELSDALLNQPQVRRGDSLRLAGWLLDVGEEVPSALAAKAACEAIGVLEPDLADRLIGIALASGADGYLENYAAGDVARAAGDVATSLDWFSRALDLASTDAEIRQSSMALAQVYGFYLSESISAVKVLEEAANRLSSPVQRLELQSERALFAAMMGQFEDVLDAATAVLNHPDCDFDAAWTAITNVTWAEAQLLRFADLEEHLDHGFRLLPDVAIERAGEIDLLRCLDIGYRMTNGTLDQAVGEIRGLDYPGNVAAGVADYSLSLAHLVRGDYARAAELAQRSIDTLSRYDAFNALPFVLGYGAFIRIVEGDRPGAIERIESSIARGGETDPWGQIWIPFARAWLAADDSEPAAAIELVRQSGQTAMDTSHLAWAMTIYHASVPWGGAIDILSEVRSLTKRIGDTPLTSTYLAHIEAAADGDLDRLTEVMDRFTSYGALMHAAQARAEIARLETEPTRSCLHATRAIIACPRTVLLPAGTTELALSERQIEIALAAADGQASKAIAEKLFLSARTVDNHLRTVYQRLGVAGRSGLAEALG